MNPTSAIKTLLTPLIFFCHGLFIEVHSSSYGSGLPFAIGADSDNRIWISTFNDLHRFDGSSWTNMDEKWGIETSGFFFHTIESSGSEIIVASANNGVFHLDFAGNLVRRYLPNQAIFDVSSYKNYILIGTNEGLQIFNKNTGEFIKTFLQDKSVKVISVDDGFSFVSTEKQIYKLDLSLFKVIEEHTPGFSVTELLVHNSVLFISSQTSGLFLLANNKFDKLPIEAPVKSMGVKDNILYFSSSDKICKYDLHEKKLIETSCSQFKFGRISGLEITSNGVVWVASENGLFRTDELMRVHGNILDDNIFLIHTKQNDKIWKIIEGKGVRIMNFGQIEEEEKNVVEIDMKEYIYSILVSGERVMLGTNKGLFVHSIDGTFLNQFTPVNSHVTGILDLGKDKFLLGTNRGLQLLDFKTKKFIKNMDAGLDKEVFNASNNKNITKLYADNSGRIWILGDGVIFAYDEQSTLYEIDVSKKLSFMNIAHLENQIYIGTRQNGVFILDAESLKVISRLTVDQSLLSNSIVQMETHQNQIIIRTPEGVQIFNPSLNKFSLKIKTKIKPFINWSFFAKDNILYFLYDNLISEVNIVQEIPQADSIVSRISVNDIELDSSLYQSKAVDLENNLEKITIYFTNSLLQGPEKISCKAGLDSLPTELLSSKNAFTLQLNPLSYGTQSLIYQCTDSFGNWLEPETLLLNIKMYSPSRNIIVISPIVLVLLILVMLRWRTRLTVLRAQRAEDLVRARTKELQERTLELTTETENSKRLYQKYIELHQNFTHEFRTPITVIIGNLKYLLTANNETERKEIMKTLDKTSKGLAHLIERVIDLSSAETINTNVGEKSNLASVISLVLERFQALIKDKKIQLTVNKGANGNVQINQESLNLIIQNLISNAVKYSTAGATITINTHYKPAKQQLEFKIRNSGKGIDSSEINNIFSRFYRCMNDKDSDEIGSGIGLAIVKEQVEAIGGSIQVDSVVNQYTEFSVVFPMALQDLEESKNTEFHQSNEENLTELLQDKPRIKDSAEESISKVDKPDLLIVEDNKDLQALLHRQLSSQFRLLTAYDGEEGLMRCQSVIPDLVISDIDMPKMDGFDLLARIKGQVTTSHIPVLLLTAKSSLASRMRGWEYEADAYLSKPFDEKELSALCHALLANRKRLHRVSQKRTAEVEKNTKPNVDTLSQKFINRLDKLVEERMGDTELQITELAEQMAMSTRTFQRKIAAIANVTPQEYLRQQRLNFARVLIQKEYSVSQVTSMVGYKSVSGFSKAYKSFFNRSPSQDSIS